MTSVGASSNFVESKAGNIVWFIENLIEHYHNENILWDVNNANFRNLKLKDAAWCALALP